MNSELLNLIDLAIADGTITDKERAVILRKALALGEDPDEVEMILDGKLALARKDIEAFPSQSPMDTGSVVKCSACGASVDSFATRCGDCGNEYRAVKSTQSVTRFFEMITELENHREPEETNPLRVLGKTYSKLLSGSGLIGNASDDKKRALISAYPIPNTREDILEFLSMAVPRSKKKGGFLGGYGAEATSIMEHNKLVPVWHTKCEQIVMKARFSMKDDKKTLEEIEYYAKELNIK